MQPFFNTLSFCFVAFICAQSCSNPPTQTPPSVSQAETTIQKMDSVADSLPAVVAPNAKMAGLSFVAPPRPFKAAVMNEVKTVNASWIATIPYAFTALNKPSVQFSEFGGQWWGESVQGVRVTIDSAHQAGIKVMLKPQVYIPGGWTGGLDFATDADWEKWERDYEKYLMRFVDLGIEMKVDAICIGTEFKTGVAKREKFWRSLITKIRSKYKGLLTYSSNWDEYPIVPFWDALDFAGINAYMPLSDKETPSVSELCVAWKPYFEQIKAFQAKIKKPIVFTEYGYMSVDGCAGKGWEVEPKVRSLRINQLAQANAIEALHKTFSSQTWWQGGFLWKWFPDGEGHEGYKERDYTPQGKKAATTLNLWHSKYKVL
ncbi:MAG: hypothetical protein JNL70_05625 [Saprospiraceae bacterium]|nr:hypothetical protein [Saprospiraceae bacterium]